MWLYMLQAQAAPAVPPYGDRTGYDFAVVGRAGVIEGGLANAGVAGFWAPTPRFALEIGAESVPGDTVHHQTVWDGREGTLASRLPSWALTTGAILSASSNGLQGVGLVVRTSAGPVRYGEQDPLPEGASWGGKTRARAETAVRVAFVGHPGVIVAGEVGAGGTWCCEVNTIGGQIGPVARLDIGAAFPPGPSPAAIRAARTPEQQERIRRRTSAALLTGACVGAMAVVGTVGGIAIYEAEPDWAVDLLE